MPLFLHELLSKRTLLAKMLAVEQQCGDRCVCIFIVPGEGGLNLPIRVGVVSLHW